MLNLEKVIKLLKENKDKAKVLEIFERIRKISESLGCKVYLIGSWAEGKATPSSDIDILVICKKLPRSMLERGKIKAEIMEKASVPQCEDVHIELISEREQWYYLSKG